MRRYNDTDTGAVHLHQILKIQQQLVSAGGDQFPKATLQRLALAADSRSPTKVQYGDVGRFSC